MQDIPSFNGKPQANARSETPSPAAWG